MTNFFVLDPISGRLYASSIIRSESIPGYGILHHAVIKETGDIIPVIIANGVQFTPCDWQNSNYPRGIKEIQNVRWMDNNGKDAVMLNGLPRTVFTD